MLEAASSMDRQVDRTETFLALVSCSECAEEQSLTTEDTLAHGQR